MRSPLAHILCFAAVCAAVTAGPVAAGAFLLVALGLEIIAAPPAPGGPPAQPQRSDDVQVS